MHYMKGSIALEKKSAVIRGKKFEETINFASHSAF